MSETAEQPDDDEKLIGETLAGRYQIETRLGEGAMGAVYRARHVKVGRAFAVKVLHARLLEDGKVAQRFEREAELAGRLRHPNVIGVVDVGETPGGLRYMVMDFAAGRDLAALLDEAPMRPERIIHLTRQLLEGLYHAHEAGLIHRDFKPENVIVETDMHGGEVPRIVDFGIAILRDGGDSPNAQGRLTTNGLVLGTPHYMAPEQAVADPIDHRIDLFALGIVVYEMLCGKLPFDGTGAEIARANLLLDPPKISQRVPYLEVDPLLEAFSRRMMAKKRDHRPATAKAARELLDLIERDRPAAAAALGVPLEHSTRMPAVTQPVAPQRRVAASGNDTFPPPVSAASLEAPPVQARIPGSHRDLATDLTDPLTYGEQRPRAASRRWVIVGLGALATGGILAFALSRGGGDSAAAQEAPAMPPPAPVVAKAPVAEPPVAPPPAPPPVVETIQAPPPEKAAPEKLPEKTPDKTPDKVAAKPVKKQPQVKQAVKQVEVKQPEIKKETAPAQTDASTLAARYGEVGRKLKAAGEAANDLWPRYRLIQIQDAIRDPAKRAEAMQILGKLDREVAGFKK